MGKNYNESGTTKQKSTGVSLRKIRLEMLKSRTESDCARAVELEEFEEDDDLDSLLNTLRLIAEAQKGCSC